MNVDHAAPTNPHIGTRMRLSPMLMTAAIMTGQIIIFVFFFSKKPVDGRHLRFQRIIASASGSTPFVAAMYLAPDITMIVLTRSTHSPTMLGTRNIRKYLVLSL